VSRVVDRERAFAAGESAAILAPPASRRARLFSSSAVTSLRRILPAYLLTRFVLIVAIYFGFVLFTSYDYQWASVNMSDFFHSLSHWDASYYLHIARFGYILPNQTAFLPLYPLLIRAVAVLTVQRYYVAALLVTNGALLVALATLYLLVREDFSEDVAQRTILSLLLFPTAVFLAAPYNESLFLALILQFFYHLRRQRWWAVALLGALATATRTAGVILIVPLLVEFYQERPWTRRSVLRLGIVAATTGLGLALYAAYCYIAFGDALIFSQVQSEYWYRSFMLPWSSLIWGIRALVTAAPASFYEVHSFLDLGATVIFLVLLVYGWRRFRPSYNWFVAAMLIFFLLFPSNGLDGMTPLVSNQRFVLELFPGFITLALWARTPTRQTTLLVLSSGLFFLLTTLFITGRWLV